MKVQEIRKKKLSNLIREYGTQKAFAEAAGLDVGHVSQMMTGRRSIGERVARKIEKNLGKPEGWMDSENGDGTPQKTPPPHANVAPGPDLDQITTVPVVGTTEAGPDREWFELGYPPGYGEDYIDVPAKDPCAYALRISGNSMEPRMHEGELVLVYPSWDAQPGDEVVVRMKHGEVMVKRLAYIRGDRIGLDSVSDGYGRIERKREEIEFMHPVVGVIRPTAVRRRK